MCPYHNLLEKLEQYSVLNVKESLQKGSFDSMMKG